MKKTAAGNVTTAAEAREAETRAFNRQRYGEVIHTRRTQLGLSQAQLAQRLGVQKAYVTHWEAGRSRPDLNLVPALCAELGISLAAFFHAPAAQDSLTPAEQRHLADYRSITDHDRQILDAALEKMVTLTTAEVWARCRRDFRPIYRNEQSAAAGSGEALASEPAGEQIFIRNTWLSQRADEIVTVSGASMEPAYHDGQAVYVAHTAELAPGEIGLFVVNGDGFIKAWQGDHLHSLNPAYPDIPLGEFDECRLIGRVLGAVDPGDLPTAEEQAVLAELRRSGEIQQTPSVRACSASA